MKADYTHISIVLDRSGSMSSIASDTIGGFNRFLEDQQAVPGQATLTLVQFDYEYEVLYSGVPIAVVQPLTRDTFIPRGTTALLDAIGRTILESGEYLSALSEEQRPAKVIFVILTDGIENASKLYTSSRIHEMIDHQRKFYAWEFVFLGANQDAIASARRIGIPQGLAMSFAADGAGARDAFESLHANTRKVRVGGQSVTMNWSD